MKRLGVFLLMGLLSLIPLSVWASEETPFFIGEIYYPNAFIIYDNSDSMQDVPYTNPGGITVRPSGQRWDYDVMQQDGSANRDANDFLQWFQRADRADDPRLASGGDHPASKLYQAKQALNAILNDIENVNLGFATYLSRRTPKVVALYYRTTPGYTRADYWTYIPTRWQWLGALDRVDRPNTTQPWPTQFTAYGVMRNNMHVGDTFTRYWTDGNVYPTACPLRSQALTYTVTSVTEVYGGDGQFQGYRWEYEAPYTDYAVRTINDADYDPGCAPDQGWNLCSPTNLPVSTGTWTRVTSPSASCRLWQKLKDSNRLVTGTSRPERYEFNWYTTYGTWSAAAGDPRYIDPATLAVIPSSMKGTWQLVTSTLTDVTVGTAGTTATMEPGSYPYDSFTYPSVGSATPNPDRPHAWSYVHWVSDWSWRDADQPDPFFPATVGNEDANITGDDHIIFVNLPDADTNDTAMAHRDAILEFVSVERYDGHPRYTDYDYTTMPYTRSVPPNTWADGYWDLNANNTYESGEPRKATPLAASLRYAKRYYESYITQDSQTQQDCRDSYIILLTDGLDTADCNPTEDYANCTSPATAAAALRAIDIGGTIYEVKTYVVGFGLEAGQAANLDTIAAAGGTNAAYLATNVNELVETLSAIFQSITQGRYARSDPTISRAGDRIYTAYFNFPGWAGHLKAWVVADDGSVTGEVNTWGGSDVDNLGDAGGSILDQSARTVYTTAGTGLLPTRVGFDYALSTDTITFHAGSAITDIDDLIVDIATAPAEDDIDEDSDVDSDDALLVLHYTMDPAYGGSAATGYPYKGTRNANWLLGDFYHTTPVVVGPPPFNIDWGDYPDFKAAHASRDTVAYLGSNGGMLEAINDTDGTERWAYIPRMALGSLKGLKVEHQFMVDGKPTIADIYSSGGAGTVFAVPSVPNPEEGWHTVVICGMRDGGKGYFALEVTDPDNPIPLWELTDANMGYTWSVPAVARVRINIGGTPTDKWVAFVGGGYSTTANEGNRLYIIDIEKGQILTDGTNVGEYVIDTDMGDGDLTDNTVPSSIKEVDLNKDGYVERIYFGDTEGIMWKVDLTSNNMADWVPCRLLNPATYDFSALNPSTNPNAVAPRPIYHKPAVARADSGYNLVFFGTGDEHQANSTTSQDFFYEVEDTGSRTGAECTGEVNWVKVLDVGEKVLARPSVFNYVVYFTTYLPSAACEAGLGFLYGVTMSRGVNSESGGEAGLLFEPNTGTPYNTPQSRAALGIGVPSAPIVTNGTLYATTSNHQGESDSIDTVRINPLGGQIRGWREVY